MQIRIKISRKEIPNKYCK